MMAIPRTLIFLHIPKTGGTTFRRILAGNYSRKEILTFRDPDYSAEVERFVRSAESERARYRLIQGHVYFGFHRFVPGDSSYVTWMRDPISRALSFYSYVRTHPEHYLHRRLIDEDLDLKNLLERNETPELFNLQTRMIAGERSNVDRSTLEIAKKNLEEKFCFVGLTENFDASLILLAEILGWKVPFYMKRNVTSERIAPQTVDAETGRLLREANALDIELHQFARDVFEAKRRAAGAAFESKLDRFQRVNSIGTGAQRYYEKMKAAFKNPMTVRESSPKRPALKEGPASPSI